MCIYIKTYTHSLKLAHIILNIIAIYKIFSLAFPLNKPGHQRFFIGTSPVSRTWNSNLLSFELLFITDYANFLGNLEVSFIYFVHQFLEQKYGYYHCRECNLRWESAYVWCVQGTNKVTYFSVSLL